MRASRVNGKVAGKKHLKVLNMNHPKDVPPDVLERFWGEPTPEDAEFAENLRKCEAKKKFKPNIF
jgi:hypothetical protein